MVNFEKLELWAELRSWCLISYSSFTVKKVEERRGDRSSLTKFAKGIADLGAKGGLR